MKYKKDNNVVVKGGRKITMSRYIYLHTRLVQKYGKAGKCEFCRNQNARRYEYALKKGREYSENVEDYLQLCPSCHRKYDYNPEAGKKVSEAQKGVPKPKVSIALKGKAQPWNWVAINQKTIKDELLSTFDSVEEAAKKTGVIRTGILNALSGRAKTSGGFIWEYAA